MVRAIYSIKMSLYHNQFNPQQPELTRSQKSRGLPYNGTLLHHLQELLLFVPEPSSTGAPRYDLHHLTRTVCVSKQTGCKRGKQSIWKTTCLSQELVGFSFFNDEVTAEGNDGWSCQTKIDLRIFRNVISQAQVLEPATKKLHDFVSKSTLNLFKIRDLPDNFLDQDLIKWEMMRHTRRVRIFHGQWRWWMI